MKPRRRIKNYTDFSGFFLFLMVISLLIFASSILRWHAWPKGGSPFGKFQSRQQHFAGECFLFKLYFKKRKLGLLGKPKIIKVAPRVEKTKVFKKDWNFVNLSLFCELHHDKNIYHGGKNGHFFLNFHFEIIC